MIRLTRRALALGLAATPLTAGRRADTPLTRKDIA